MTGKYNMQTNYYFSFIGFVSLSIGVFSGMQLKKDDHVEFQVMENTDWMTRAKHPMVAVRLVRLQRDDSTADDEKSSVCQKINCLNSDQNLIYSQENQSNHQY